MDRECREGWDRLLAEAEGHLEWEKEYRGAGMACPKMPGDSRGWTVKDEWFWVIVRVYVWEGTIYRVTLGHGQYQKVRACSRK